MKLLVAAIILMMSWEPSCRPDSSPTASGWSEPYYDPGYNPGHNNDPLGYTAFKGRVLDDSTGDDIDDAEICAHWGGRKGCQLAGRFYKDGYQFKLSYDTVPYDVKIKVTHPDYESDSLMDTVRVEGRGRVYDFHLTPIVESCAGAGVRTMGTP